MATAVLDDDRLTEVFAALAHPTRRAMLARLAHGEASVNELAEPFQLTLPAVSKHIKVLEGAGLILRSRRAQTRPCALNPAAFAAVSSWVEQYREIWDDRLDTLDRYLRTLPTPEEGRPR